MHVVVPKAVGFDFGNSYIELNRVRHVLWVSEPGDETEVEQNLSFFREHRRKTFSDVCHAKLCHGRRLTDPGAAFVKVGSYVCGPFCEKTDPFYKTGVTNGQIDTLESDGHTAIYISCAMTSSNARYIDLNCTIHVMCRVRYQYPYIYTKEAKCDMNAEIDRITSRINFRFRKYPPTQLRAMCETVARDHIAGALDLEHGNPSGYQASAEKLYNSALLIANDFLANLDHRAQYRRRTNIQVMQVEVDDTVFLLHEPGVIMDKLDDAMYGRGTESYFRNSLIQQAYLDLIKSVPRMNENNISNLLEITSFIKGLVVDHRVDMPKSLSDSWLAYRYSYGTTKMDAEEAIKFMRRRRSLGDWTNLKVHGQSSLTYKDSLITCRAVATVSPRFVDELGKAWRALYTYGLSPNFYVIWDMLPYSFVVDWILPIGDILSAWDAEREFKEYYDVRDVQFSLSYKVQNSLGDISCYSRWLTAMPPELQGWYMLENNPSTKTVIKRVLDAGALILG